MKAVTTARDATLETPVGSEWRKFARGGAWSGRADARQAQAAPHDGRHDGGLAGLPLLTIIRHDNLRFTGQDAHEARCIVDPAAKVNGQAVPRLQAHRSKHAKAPARASHRDVDRRMIATRLAEIEASSGLSTRNRVRVPCLRSSPGPGKRAASAGPVPSPTRCRSPHQVHQDPHLMTRQDHRGPSRM